MKKAQGKGKAAEKGRAAKAGKILLAYSGGLDTSVAITWLKEKYQAEVITYSADVGQDEDWDKVRDKALKTGADKVYIDNLQEEFITDYAFKGLKANALYEGKYPLATALARPLIAEKMMAVAADEGVDAVAHGCTGKGNDQVRFDVSFRALDPEMEIIAPLRQWEFKSRLEEIEYAREHNIPVKVTRDSPYSLDTNLWGVSIECGQLEDPWQTPPADAYQWTADPAAAPDTPLELKLTFQDGIPVKLNDQYLSPVKLVAELNRLGSAYGVGRIDLVENRLVGIKSREIYEAPAATILIEAHRQLESLILDRETLHFKKGLEDKYAELIYYGLWFSPLREALEAFIESTQTGVSGEIKMQLYKGQAVVTGRKSPSSLYQYKLATYDAADQFDHQSAEGFIKLWGLPLQVWAGVKRKNSRTTTLKKAAR